MPTVVPYVTFSAPTLQAVNPMLTTNFQAVNRALGERVVGHRISLLRYAATGDTASALRLGYTPPQGSVPWAVLLVRAREVNDPGKDLPAVTPLNFSQDGGTLTLHEPSGLMPNVLYDLEFLVLEG